MPKTANGEIAMSTLSKNDRVIFWSAEADLRDHKFHQVLNKTEHLEKKYPEDSQIHLLMAQALSNLKRTEDAYQIVFDYRDHLFDKPDYLPGIFKITLQNHAFILAREILSHVSGSRQSAWKAEIIKQETAYRTENQSVLRQAASRFAHLGSLAAYQQVQVVTAALKLPFDEYLTAAETMLTDPFGWQVSKTQVLLQLQAMASEKTVTLNWLDKQNYQISIPKLKPLADYAALTDALREIDRLYAADDPIKYQLMEKELFTQSSYIYPFFDKVIQDSAFWVQIMAADLFGSHLTHPKPFQQEMMAWIKQIHQAESFMKFV